MDSLQAPNVVTTITEKEINFVFRVHAYRKLSCSEMQQVLKIWMAQTHRKKLPANMTIDYQSILGFDEQLNR